MCHNRFSGLTVAMKPNTMFQPFVYGKKNVPRFSLAHVLGAETSVLNAVVGQTGRLTLTPRARRKQHEGGEGKTQHTDGSMLRSPLLITDIQDIYTRECHLHCIVIVEIVGEEQETKGKKKNKETRVRVTSTSSWFNVLEKFLCRIVSVCHAWASITFKHEQCFG